MSLTHDFSSQALDLTGKSILITGGTGSFGQHFVRTVVQRYNPARLVVFSRDELKQVDMEMSLPPDRFPNLRFFIGDVRDLDRLEMALRGVEIVVHAAALKHVPVAEYNPFECIRTNVIGAENVVKASIRAGVEKVIALSTDKAASPINLYGASKLASDKIFVAANNLTGRSGPHFSVVRYGNVMGSRGSVVPLFRRLIAEGASTLPITHPAMTRFWITLTQGVDFVLTALRHMLGGEIFVPKIPSMRVVDLARAMAPDLPHTIIGTRPGEKLHEMMITEDDGRRSFEFDDHFIIPPDSTNWWPSDLVAERSQRRVTDGFVYASNTNHQWLTAADILAYLEAMHGGRPA